MATLARTAPPPRDEHSTVHVEPDLRAGTGTLWFRRGFLSVLLIVVVAGSLDYLGVRSRTATARSADGATTMRVHYAQVARADLDVPFTVTISERGGFHGDVVVGVSSSYLQLFNRGAIDPEPSSSTTTPDAVIWRFDAPRGDTFVMSLDLEVQGGRHWGRSGTVTVSDSSGDQLVKTTVKTWLAP
jgi:hypothetical protein